MGSSSAEQMDELTLRRTASLWLASEEAKGEEDTAAGLARLALDVPFSLWSVDLSFLVSLSHTTSRQYLAHHTFWGGAVVTKP
jgi:hypothetical protein